MEALKRLYANFRGFDEPGSTVPMMDGPLKPNNALDAASVVLRMAGIDNLTATPAGLVCSGGAALMRLRAAGAALEASGVRSFSSEITCLAADAAGALAIGLDGQGILVQGGRHDGVEIKAAGGVPLRSPSAASFLDPDTLVVANGSAEYRMSDWKRDLMNRRATGSVWRIALAKSGEATPLARNLAFPYGLALGENGTILAAESWRHRIVALDAGRSRAVFSDLPAYPARIAPAAGGGFWLALFAPRNQLIEFVLREEDYRRRMVATIDPAYWIAPSLSSGLSFLEPIQGGARKKLNMLKPWSPSWSYGLVVRCDANMRPLESFHSRADGSIHGVTSLVEVDGVLLAGAKGSGAIVRLQDGAVR
ncbi:NHL repeat containing protein [Dongia sp. agr-C8]